MRFRRRKAVPVAERAAAGVLWWVLCFFVSLSGIPDTKLRHTTVRKNYEDETRHPSSGGTTGGAGC